VTSHVTHELIFASIYGGETSINQWFGSIENRTIKRFECPLYENCREHEIEQITIRDHRALYKKRMKVQNDTFENLLHTFVYDKFVQQIEGEVIAHVLVDAKAKHIDQLWSRLKDMTATPVLDEWKDSIITALFDRDKIVKNNVFSKAENLACYSIYLESQFDLNEIVLEQLHYGDLVLPD
jgi:IS1 family transposase